MSDYAAFLERKRLTVAPAGFSPHAFVAPLFPFQRDIVTLACRLGRFCIWADCGMGKTPMQLEWAHQVAQYAGGRVLILAPLAVSHQTVREAEKFNIPGVAFVASGDEVPIGTRIVVTNYQKLDHFSAADFVGVVLDESSILKAHDGKTRTHIIDTFAATPFKLACSATPAPNDHMELGNHAEFLGVMSRAEMLAMFFTHDGGETAKWRLKGHANARFWEWVCSWAVTIRKPSDLGYDDGAFTLPPLELRDHVVETPREQLADANGQHGLFAQQAQTLGDQLAVRRDTIDQRVGAAVTIANSTDEQVLVWCNLNDESAALARQIHGAVEVSGGDTDEHKERAALWFIGEKCLCQSATSGRRTTGDGLRRTAIVSGNTGSKPRNAGTHEGGSSIQMKSTDDSGRSKTPRTGARTTRTLISRTDSSHSESPLTSTGASLIGRVEAAASADAQTRATEAGSPLITATQQETCAAFSVTAAITDSDTSGTIQDGSSQPQCTCGHRSGRRVLISKPSIFGWGLNFQNCRHVVFVGLSHSYEAFYQAVRRCWRYGQTRDVQCHIVYDWAEGAVIENIRRKEEDAERMATAMVEIMKTKTMEQLQKTQRQITPYAERVTAGEAWTAYQGDCVEAVSKLDSDSIHYSIFSPPFASLYTYSNSDRDMGNCKAHEDFESHFGYLVRELHRVLMPGRLVSFHCMNLPRSKERDGVIGVRDFRGELIRLFESHGFIFHSEVCIWKDPVTAMQRTKAIGLLHKQIVKDSSISRQGIPDYLVTMRKRGENPERVAGRLTEFAGENPPRLGDDATRTSINIWQRYASPVWMDINPSDTLQFRHARDNDDERHICPLQLDVIRRGIQLWTNPGDVVLSPFMGIGSEGYIAIEMGRAFVGVELKPSYFDVAVKNLHHASSEARQHDGLFTDEVPA